MADTDPGSLDRLHDLVTPLPVSSWPPAPGWFVVGTLGLVLLIVCTWTVGVRWSRNRYRREALRMLNRYAASADNLPAVAELVKRVSLAAYPRDRVAALTGLAWQQFLDETGGRPVFTTGPGQLLESSLYLQSSAPLAEQDWQAILAAVRYWIWHHRC